MAETQHDCSQSIEEIDLGQSVLTLTEVVQTFEVESPMLNIKLQGENAKNCRTVVLTKNKVEVDGKSQIIVVINDVTDRVRLARES